MKTTAVFPLSIAHIPGDTVSLRVFESRYLEMLAEVMSGDRTFVSVLISRGSEVGGGDSRVDHGVEISIDRIESHPESLVVTGRAVSAVSVASWLDDSPYPRALVEPQAEVMLRETERFDVAASLSLLAQRTRSVIEMMDPEGSASRRVEPFLGEIAGGRWWDERVADEELWRAFWRLAGQVPCGPLDRSHLLEAGPLPRRVERLKRILDHVAEVVEFRFGQ